MTVNSAFLLSFCWPAGVGMEYNGRWYTSASILQPHTELSPKVPPDLFCDLV